VKDKIIRKAICLTCHVVLVGFCIHPANVLSMSKNRTVSRPPELPHAEVKLPVDYILPEAKRLQFKGRDIIADLYSGGFAQGMAVYAEIYKPTGMDKELSVQNVFFNHKDILPLKRSWGYRCIFGIDPSSGAGTKKLDIHYTVGDLARKESFNVRVSKTEYLYSATALDLGRYSDVDYKLSREEIEFIAKCSEKKKKVFGQTGPDIMTGYLSHPRDRHYVTSPFWSQRVIMKYRKKNGRKIRLKNKLNIHKGVDLRGNAGDQVYSMAGGTVVIAEAMYYEGNFIVIDHGNRIFSYYMHLNDFTVKEGHIVRAGELIGHVGSSGLSTAPHLHVSVMIQNVNVDPLSMLMLPVRD
jgi:murein DD-endopeptidase